MSPMPIALPCNSYRLCEGPSRGPNGPSLVREKGAICLKHNKAQARGLRMRRFALGVAKNVSHALPCNSLRPRRRAVREPNGPSLVREKRAICSKHSKAAPAQLSRGQCGAGDNPQVTPPSP
ncbi:hypothetical protein CEXT_394851 [Caerostris extrusa]|uniref:Uncharacterized protein n=1 Tax=Caerostris extrusa TaxID=172846 RepID=A0AAV4X850_CAEEX|nr:hypothetical protein CEXT_394851 [Caerostris extrusa]